MPPRGLRNLRRVDGRKVRRGRDDSQRIWHRCGSWRVTALRSDVVRHQNARVFLDTDTYALFAGSKRRTISMRRLLWQDRNLLSLPRPSPIGDLSRTPTLASERPEPIGWRFPAMVQVSDLIQLLCSCGFPGIGLSRIPSLPRPSADAYCLIDRDECCDGSFTG